MHGHALLGERCPCCESAAHEPLESATLAHAPKIVTGALGPQLQLLQRGRFVGRVRGDLQGKGGVHLRERDASEATLWRDGADASSRHPQQAGAAGVGAE